MCKNIQFYLSFQGMELHHRFSSSLPICWYRSVLIGLQPGTECLQTTSHDLRSLILMDGMDLNVILTDRIRLDDLLYGKRRHASETGTIDLNVNKILVS